MKGKLEKIGEMLGTKKLETVKGTNTIKITNILGMSEAEAPIIAKRLLKPLVRNENLLKILCQENNIKQLAFKIEYEAKLIGTNGETIGTIVGHDKSIREAIEILKKGEEGKPYSDADYERPLIEKTKSEGWKYKHQTDGTLRNIELKITLLK